MLCRIRCIVLLALLVLGTLTILFHIQSVEARTIIVPDDYPTIQAAINAAASRDTVFVRNGTHYEHIEINRPLTLVGEDNKTTIIDGNGTRTVTLITASYASISNFTVRNAGLKGQFPFDSCVYVVMELGGIDVENNSARLVVSVPVAVVVPVTNPSPIARCPK
jgi:nitrous oxidase accessory protein NosD